MEFHGNGHVQMLDDWGNYHDDAKAARNEATLEAATASHRFSPYEAEVVWSPSGAHFMDHSHSSLLQRQSKIQEQPVRILHLTDNHISVDDPDPPLTSRMFNAFIQTSDHDTQRLTSPQEEFTALLRKAKRDGVDLIALGGDLVNYPSHKSVAWVLEQLRKEAGDIPFIYTAGNHDWHEEGVATDRRYDSARLSQLNATLRPLFDHSVASANHLAGPEAGRLYGKTSVRGVDVIFIDNSNYQVNEEQYSFLQRQLQEERSKPAVLLMHMPLKLKGTPPLEPKYLCGHPDWGAATDTGYETELRPQWPKEGNSASTNAFIQLVQQHSAPAGRLAVLLTGHVHKDFSSALEDQSVPNPANLTALACESDRPGCQLRTPKTSGQHEAMGALQYTTLDAAEGGYRLLTIHGAEVQAPSRRLTLKNVAPHE
jgi:predicted MPP superfamily phosphohydrolase